MHPSDLESIDVTLEQSLMRSGDEEVVRWTADADDVDQGVAADTPADALRMLADELEEGDVETDCSESAEEMIEILEDDPDGAALFAVEDLGVPNPQFHTRMYGPDSDRNLKRRYVAHMMALALGNHYPAEVHHGGTKAAGGDFRPPGAGYQDPVIEWDRKFDDGGDEA